MKRVTWFVVGAASGIGSARLAKKKMQQTVERLSPDHVARQTMIRLKHVGQDIADAVRDGRGAMAAKESELRARRDGHAVTIPNLIDTTEVSHLDEWRRRRQ